MADERTLWMRSLQPLQMLQISLDDNLGSIVLELLLHLEAARDGESGSVAAKAVATSSACPSLAEHNIENVITCRTCGQA